MSVFSAFVTPMDAACIAAFGDAISYQTNPPFGVPFLISAIIQGPSVEEEIATPTHLALFVRLSAFTSPPLKGDQVTIGTKTYTVFEINADLEAGATLSLQEA